MKPIQIPADLDKVLFVMWEIEEAFAFLIGFVLVAQITGSAILGLVAAYIAFRLMRVFKARQPRGAIRHWLYWHGIMSFQKTKWFSGLEREVTGK